MRIMVDSTLDGPLTAVLRQMMQNQIHIMAAINSFPFNAHTHWPHLTDSIKESECILREYLPERQVIPEG